MLEEFSMEDRCYFIQHWTGTPKLPAEGVKGLGLTIAKANSDKRIYGQTCFSRINLPVFNTR